MPWPGVALIAILALLKGVTLALGCLGLAGWKLLGSPELDHYDDLRYLTQWMIGLSIIALLGGAGLGALAGRLRSDRLLVLVGLAFGGVTFAYAFVLGHPPSERAAQVLVLPAYLWVGLGAVLLAWWTHPPAKPTLPLARLRRAWFPRPRWRNPTMVEMAVGTAIATAFVIALGIGALARPEYSHWYKHTPIIDGHNFWLLVGVLIAVAIPCGVVCGLVARIPLLPSFVVAAPAALGAACSGLYVKSLGPIEFPAWSWGVIAGGVFALARYQAGNATSRDAGNTSTTP